MARQQTKAGHGGSCFFCPPNQTVSPNTTEVGYSNFFANTEPVAFAAVPLKLPTNEMSLLISNTIEPTVLREDPDNLYERLRNVSQSIAKSTYFKYITHSQPTTTRKP